MTDLEIALFGSWTINDYRVKVLELEPLPKDDPRGNMTIKELADDHDYLH